jgi:hypothetical protein
MEVNDRMQKFTLSLAGALLLALGTTTARADISISTGNVNQQGDENVLFLTNVGPAPELVGHTNQTDTLFSFLDAGENIQGQGGQASVSASDGTLTQLTLQLTDPPGGTFTSLIFNINRTAQTTGTLEVCATGSENICDTFQIPGDSPSGFFTITAVMNQFIQSVNFTILSGDLNITAVDQVRVGGALTSTAVPEPSSVFLFGTIMSVVGFGVRRKFMGA